VILIGLNQGQQQLSPSTSNNDCVLEMLTKLKKEQTKASVLCS